MFCPKCGKQIPDGSAVCPECGASFNADGTVTPPGLSKKFGSKKIGLWLVIAMFVAAFLESWVAMTVLLLFAFILVKDNWCTRNSIQPFAVGMFVVIAGKIIELLQGTAMVRFIPGFNQVMPIILTYTLEAVRIVGIILLLIGVVTLFRGEVKIPLFSKIGAFFKEEEKKD